MINQLQAARDVIDTAELYAVPADDRNLAEGYRYLMGFLLGSLERALDDPMYPRFHRAIQPMNRAPEQRSECDRRLIHCRWTAGF